MIETPNKTNNNKKKLAIIGVLGLVLIAVGVQQYVATPSSKELAGKSPAAGAPGGDAGGPPPMKVEATKALKEELNESLKLVGSLTSNESVTISSEIAGRIIEIPFTEGGSVKAGDVLFRLDSAVQKAQLGQAEANFSLAQNNAKRYGGLVETGAISKVQMEQAEADLSLATANIEFAKANLAKTTIRAPFSGVAGIRQVSLGDIVSNGQKLVNLEQMSPIRVQFTAPEKFLNELKTGHKIIMTGDANPGVEFEAEIFAIDPRIDPNTRSVAIQARADNSNAKLYPGQFVTINLPISGVLEAITIPDQALIPNGNITTVYTVVDGKAKANEVKVGNRATSKAQIISGINEGDLVITAGHQKIGPGSPVRVVEPTVVKVKPAEEEDENTLKE